MSRRMDCAVSDSFRGVLPYQVYATLVIRACSFTLVHPCREDYLSIAVSMVTGRFMLKPDPTTRNYILYLLVPGFASLRGCRGRELGGMFNVYNLLLYIVAATSASLLPLLLYLNC